MAFNAGLELDSGMYQEFDDFEVTLGDIMRGERATRGKSITDVRLELRLPKSYILAIENGDLSAFRCPEFVRGYIYSYAHYLGLDPSQAFSTFCLETGFSLPDKMPTGYADTATRMDHVGGCKCVGRSFLACTSALSSLTIGASGFAGILTSLNKNFIVSSLRGHARCDLFITLFGHI